MDSYRFILEPYKGIITRHRCPNCNKQRKFTRYIDTETNEHIHNTVGKCDRLDNCGYHYTPKQYFNENKSLPFTPTERPKKFSSPIRRITSYIPEELFRVSLAHHENNNFSKYLVQLFGVDIASKLLSRYFIATSKHWRGATIFWQIDLKGKVRTGKIMLYDAITGKRIKKPFNHINWVHTVLKQPDFELKQCFFGEHLLIDKSKPVAIVESEKTAVIASVYLPQFVWLAVGSLNNLNAEKCIILYGRTVTLFPDLNGFEKWTQKAKELEHIAIFTVSDLLEKIAVESERHQGLDVADYLIQFEYLQDFSIVSPK